MSLSDLEQKNIYNLLSKIRHDFAQHNYSSSDRYKLDYYNKLCECFTIINKLDNPNSIQTQIINIINNKDISVNPNAKYQIDLDIFLQNSYNKINYLETNKDVIVKINKN